MGEVYRARDTSLGRDVAIKVLPADLADDPQMLGRFEREAKVVAQLSHPGILAIHEFGRQGDVAFAVMELLEGETLRARLNTGALPARKAIQLAAEIAEGLAAAHEKGVIHRDLKPENIFLTAEGRVKLLDFGLAARQIPDGVSASNITTQTEYTAPGTVMGTAGYMAPEQIRGEAVDHRADIFSFGAVLYEMLAGRRAFGRKTVAESQAAILMEDAPEIALTDPALSPALQGIVRRCLEKKPGERFQSATDLAFALQSLVSGATVPPRDSAAAGRSPFLPLRRLLLVLGITALLAATAIAAYRAGVQAHRPLTSPVSFRQLTFHPQAIFQAAYAPDGETIVYSAALQGNVPELFTIRPEYPEPLPLGLPDTHLLSVSSKGELAVLTNARYYNFRMFIGTLARVPLGSTAPREILEQVRQADWSADGSELAIVHEVDGKDRVEYPAGKVLYETAGYLSDLRFSPAGDRIAVLDHPAKNDDGGSVIVLDLAGKRTILSTGYTSLEGLAWSLGGDEILFTARLPGLAPTLYGVDVSGHRRIVLTSAGGLTIHDVSPNGRMLMTRDEFNAEVSVLAPAATTERNLSWLDFSVMPDLSADGRKILFTESSSAVGPNYTVCFRTTDGGPVGILGEGTTHGFSPDEKWALSMVVSPPQLILYPTGPGKPRVLPRGNLQTYHGSAGWFADGKHVLFDASEAGKALRCYMQDTTSGGLPRPVTPEGTSECRVSPDGLRVLYSEANGTRLIQAIAGGAAEPVRGVSAEDRVMGWCPDGGSLYVLAIKNLPFRIEQLDLASSRRKLVREIAPADRTGVLTGWNADLSTDGRAYAYDYYRMKSQLFAVEGFSDRPESAK